MKSILLILCCLPFIKGYSQQYNNWYFGNKAAISFNPVNNQAFPYALLNSAMKVTAVDPYNSLGAASISDTAGNLLFYTNGVLIYNKNHQPMVNSNPPEADTGRGLANTKFRWSTIIVPQPGSNSLYYVFSSLSLGYTIPTIDQDPPGFAYSPYGYFFSIIDMAKDRGNGEVVVRDSLLATFNSQRLTAIRHADGVSVWIITQERLTNKYRAWLLTCDGLHPDYVESRAGKILGDYLSYKWAMNGMMKASPDGKQLCVVHNGDVGLNGTVDSLSFFQLFDFDNATGKISNPRTIVSHDYEQTASCEYSPDSRLLYVSRFAGEPARYFLDQYEARLPSEAGISASRVRFFTCPGAECVNDFFGMQAAPDGKIYLAANTDTLSVISRPNVKAPGCQLEISKILLNKRKSMDELPTMINDAAYDPYNNFSIEQIDSCRGIVQFEGRTAMQGPVTWLWDFGDGSSSSLQNPQHTYTSYNQPYTVKLSIRSLSNCGYIVRSHIVYPRGTYTKPAFDTVTRCDSGYTRFINQSLVLPDTSIKYYDWNFGDGTSSTEQDPIHRYAIAGSYQVTLKISTDIPCIADSITQTVEVKQLNIQAPPNQVVEAGQSMQLYVTGAGSSFQWSPPRWLSNPAIANPVTRPMDTVTYTVTATDDAGCRASDSVTLFVKNEVKGINVPSAFTPNNDGLNDIIRPLLGSQYTLMEFSIYNRWGQKLFSTSAAGEGWDGKRGSLPQDAAVYTWLLKVTDEQNKIITKKGTVMLIR